MEHRWEQDPRMRNIDDCLNCGMSRYRLSTTFYHKEGGAEEETSVPPPCKPTVKYLARALERRVKA